MVDAADLKSAIRNGCAGSSPAVRTTRKCGLFILKGNDVASFVGLRSPKGAIKGIGSASQLGCKFKPY